MVAPSALAETVTPAIFAPEADFADPVISMPFDAARSAFGSQSPAAPPTSTIAARPTIHKLAARFIGSPLGLEQPHSSTNCSGPLARNRSSKIALESDDKPFRA